VKSKNLVLYLGLAVLVFMTSAFAQSDTMYTFETINYPGDAFTQLLGINNPGKIAGYHGATINKGFTYLLSTKKFTAENFTNSAQTQVTGLNDQAKTVGFYISQSGTTAGFTIAGGVYASIVYPGTPFNQLLSQNNKGQAAGYYSTKADGSGPDHAYIYDEFGGVFELFNPAGPGTTVVNGVGDAGDLVGFSGTSPVNDGFLAQPVD